MQNHYLHVVLAVVLSFTLISCSSTDNPKEPAKPEWGEIYKEDGNIVIEGLGSVQGVKNTSLAWQTAENRARADVAKKLNSIYMGLTKDYMQSISDLVDESSEEQMIETAQKSFVFERLSGVQIVDRDQNPESGVYWAYAKYNTGMANIADNFKKTMSSETRKRIERNSEEAMQELDRSAQEFMKGNAPVPSDDDGE